MLSRKIFIPFAIFLFRAAFAFPALIKNDAPGAPGVVPTWAPAFKQAVGTAYEKKTAYCPIWFTLAQGIVTEVFYPHVDHTQVGDLQLLVTDGKKFFSEQKKDVLSSVRYSTPGLTTLVSGQDSTGHYRLEQEIITDPHLPVLRIRTTFQPFQKGLRLFVLFKPSMGNIGNQSIGYATPEELLATQSIRNGPQSFAALLSSAQWTATSAGYVGTSDGWQDLSKNFKLTQIWPQAGPGNIALIGELPSTDAPLSFELALGFGQARSEAIQNARAALQFSFTQARELYDQGWESYLEELRNSEPGKKEFFKKSISSQRSAEIIKIHEDKLRRGAIVASLSKPGIPNSARAQDGNGGYHLIWPRDLYHAAMGLLAAGDFKTPVDTLAFFKETQKPDGSWPQNLWTDGSPFWQGLQMDEVAFPILLTSKLSQRKVIELAKSDLEMIRKAAWFIANQGPFTAQDRWEEIGGYIPSTIAAEIAGLQSAATLLADPLLQKIADDWKSHIEDWTLRQNGVYGKNYYLRVSPSGKPNQQEWIDLANGGGPAHAEEILDGGFLELVRLKIRHPKDASILNTLKIYESPELGIAGGFLGQPGITPAFTYRRYNRDAYGPGHVGGFWPLLAGERGHYAVMDGDLLRAQAELDLLEKSPLETGLIPEQAISPFLSKAKLIQSESGLGIACPLVWAHAEAILLHRSIEEAIVFDAP